MTEKATLKPGAGKLVRDPQTMEALPIEGKEVTLNNYWRRRIRCHDALIVEET